MTTYRFERQLRRAVRYWPDRCGEQSHHPTHITGLQVRTIMKKPDKWILLTLLILLVVLCIVVAVWAKGQVSVTNTRPRLMGVRAFWAFGDWHHQAPISPP